MRILGVTLRPCHAQSNSMSNLLSLIGSKSVGSADRDGLALLRVATRADSFEETTGGNDAFVKFAPQLPEGQAAPIISIFPIF